MRTVNHLALTPTDKGITITCDDRDPAAGNMSHVYTVTGPMLQNGDNLDAPAFSQTVSFQHGPVAEAGINGLTNEALLAIVIDRLEGAQEGPFKSRYNALAITKVEEAILWLSRRTLDRMSRGVEGQNKA